MIFRIVCVLALVLAACSKREPAGTSGDLRSSIGDVPQILVTDDQRNQMTGDHPPLDMGDSDGADDVDSDGIASTKTSQTKLFHYEVESTVQSRVRLGGQRYVQSFLKQTFGAHNEADLKRLIARRIVSFGGGSCDRYVEGDCVNSVPFKGRQVYSVRAGEAQMPPVRIANPAASALVARACDLMLARDASVLQGARAAGVNATSVSALPAVSDDHLRALIRHFFLLANEDANAMAKLRAVADGVTGGPKESWRFVLLSFCLSSWEVL